MGPVEEYYREDPTRWCQHALENHKRQRCLEGALIHLYGDHTPAMTNAKHAVLRLINYSVTAWNDAAGRKVEEVIELCRKAKV